jgi:hypothetical protein
MSDLVHRYSPHVEPLLTADPSHPGKLRSVGA